MLALHLFDQFVYALNGYVIVVISFVIESILLKLFPFFIFLRIKLAFLILYCNKIRFSFMWIVGSGIWNDSLIFLVHLEKFIYRWCLICKLQQIFIWEDIFNNLLLLTLSRLSYLLHLKWSLWVFQSARQSQQNSYPQPGCLHLI